MQSSVSWLLRRQLRWGCSLVRETLRSSGRQVWCVSSYSKAACCRLNPISKSSLSVQVLCCSADCSRLSWIPSERDSALTGINKRAWLKTDHTSNLFRISIDIRAKILERIFKSMILFCDDCLLKILLWKVKCFVLRVFNIGLRVFNCLYAAHATSVKSC
jgi:hypothetical protein